MEIFVQLLDELDDILCATAFTWHRLGHVALRLGFTIALSLMVGQNFLESTGWLLLAFGAAVGCLVVWSMAVLAQLVIQTREYSSIA